MTPGGGVLKFWEPGNPNPNWRREASRRNIKYCSNRTIRRLSTITLQQSPVNHIIDRYCTCIAMHVVLHVSKTAGVEPWPTHSLVQAVTWQLCCTPSLHSLNQWLNISGEVKALPGSSGASNDWKRCFYLSVSSRGSSISLSLLFFWVVTSFWKGWANFSLLPAAMVLVGYVWLPVRYGHMALYGYLLWRLSPVRKHCHYLLLPCDFVENIFFRWQAFLSSVALFFSAALQTLLWLWARPGHSSR